MKKKIVDTAFKFKFTDPELPALGNSMFAKKITELLAQAKRLAEKQAKGYEYKRVYIKKTRVKAHDRKAYWTLRPMKRGSK